MIVCGDPILNGVLAARHVGVANNSEIGPLKERHRMMESPAMAPMWNADHVALPVSAQWGRQEMAQFVDLTLIWTDILTRNLVVKMWMNGAKKTTVPIHPTLAKKI